MATIDLSQLPAPDMVEPLDYETLLAERKATLISLYPADQQEAVARTLTLESEPIVKLLQENAYRELILRQRINEAAKAVMVAYSLDGDLDQLGANNGVNGVTASGKPIPQMTITRQDGDRHSFSIADRGAYTGVSASWLHTKDPKPKKVKVKRKPKVKHLRALEHPAAKKKKTTATKTPEAREGDYLAGTEDNIFTLTTVYATKAAAMRAAKAKWDKLQRGVAEFSLTLAMGRADLYPETPVRVSGFKSVIDAQPWIISKVTHSLSGSGYTTQLEFEVLLSDVEYQAESDEDDSR